MDLDASQAGIDVLKHGGNAIDAAVVTASTRGVTIPFVAGPGGGGFMVIYLAKTHQVVTIDGRESCPSACTPTMFTDPWTGQPLGYGYVGRFRAGQREERPLKAAGALGELAEGNPVLRGEPVQLRRGDARRLDEQQTLGVTDVTVQPACCRSLASRSRSVSCSGVTTNSACWVARSSTTLPWWASRAALIITT